MRWIFSLLAIPVVALVFYTPPDNAQLYLDESVPFVGAGINSTGLDGDGILVAVIDTGINYTHPDLYGLGPDGKVVGGYNLLNPREPPMDYNGHGTQVAGIIAAEGGITGVAPKAGLLAYKVSEDGEGVRPDLIVRAIEMAVLDGADIINISLGVNKTSPRIDAAVSEATSRGVLVIAAAGNDGPASGSIGSPGLNPTAITVGATYNNLTSSMLATLEVDGTAYTVLPMLDAIMPKTVIEANMVFGGYGRESDLDGVNTGGSILLVERGSDTPGELLYFSIKEANAAAAGAAAIIVYNNEPGLFFGELVHEFVEPGYEPRIPAASMDQSDGLKIRDGITSDSRARLQFFHNPDHPVQFSSRGPTSQFYIKPDMMAPGAYINTTTTNGYRVTSGTSYAAPHVSGAAALLLQKYQNLTPEDIRSILTTTSSTVINMSGVPAGLDDVGTGRLDVGAALSSGLVIHPNVIVGTVTARSDTVAAHLDLQYLGQKGSIQLDHDIPDTNVSYDILDDSVVLLMQAPQGSRGHITITHNNIPHTVPVVIHRTQGSVETAQESGRLFFTVWHPDDWSFAKITATGRNGQTHHASLIPGQQAYLDVYHNDTYYIKADIVSGTQSSEAYDTIRVDSVLEGAVPPAYEVPWRQVAIVAVVAGTMGAIGITIHTRTGGQQQ